MSDSTFPVLGSEARKVVSLLAFDTLSVTQRERLLNRAASHYARWSSDMSGFSRDWRIWTLVRTWASGDTLMCLGRGQNASDPAAPLVRVSYRERRRLRSRARCSCGRGFVLQGNGTPDVCRSCYRARVEW